MANPVVLSLTPNQWTKVATNVTTGQIWLKDTSQKWWHTYRDTGDPAPTDRSDAMNFVGKIMAISAASGIDVYLYPQGDDDGEVRVDL